MLILRQELPHADRGFKIKYHKLIGYLGFVCCGLLIYWSGVDNIIYLALAVAVVVVAHGVYLSRHGVNFVSHIANNLFIVLYLVALIAVEYLRRLNIVPFPLDNLCVIVVSLIACRIFVAARISKSEMKANLDKYILES